MYTSYAHTPSRFGVETPWPTCAILPVWQKGTHNAHTTGQTRCVHCKLQDHALRSQHVHEPRACERLRDAECAPRSLRIWLPRANNAAIMRATQWSYSTRPRGNLGCVRHCCCCCVYRASCSVFGALWAGYWCLVAADGGRSLARRHSHAHGTQAAYMHPQSQSTPARTQRASRFTLRLDLLLFLLTHLLLIRFGHLQPLDWMPVPPRPIGQADLWTEAPPPCARKMPSARLAPTTAARCRTEGRACARGGKRYGRLRQGERCARARAHHGGDGTASGEEVERDPKLLLQIPYDEADDAKKHDQDLEGALVVQLALEVLYRRRPGSAG